MLWCEWRRSEDSFLSLPPFVWVLMLGVLLSGLSQLTGPHIILPRNKHRGEHCLGPSLGVFPAANLRVCIPGWDSLSPLLLLSPSFLPTGRWLSRVREGEAWTREARCALTNRFPTLHLQQKS